MTLLSCGGIAIIDEPGATSSTGTSSGSGSSSDICDLACQALSVCEVDLLDCRQRCKQVTPGCEQPRQAFLECLAEDVTDICRIPCDNVTHDFVECLNVLEVSGSCGAQSNVCTCIEQDEYGNTYDFQCFGENDLNCECTINGETIGRCTDHEGKPCEFVRSCCTSLVYARGFPG